jgi:flagellar biosynthesis component FlhA
MVDHSATVAAMVIIAVMVVKMTEKLVLMIAEKVAVRTVAKEKEKEKKKKEKEKKEKKEKEKKEKKKKEKKKKKKVLDRPKTQAD